jgi:signal transduction histidine kinase
VYLVDHGLEFALKELSGSTDRVFGVPCVFRSGEPVLFHDAAVATHLFYIAREAVHNAVKHAQAETITIELSRDDETVTLRIEDDGSGIPEVPDGDGMGLRIMGFRARMIGASLGIESEPGRGTAVSLSIINDLNEANSSDDC